MEPRSYRFIDLPNHVRPFGAQIVVDNLRAAGHTVTDGGTPAAGETLLFSLYWAEDLYNIVEYLTHLPQPFKTIIGGNHVTGSPRSIVSHVSKCWLGDCDDWNGSESVPWLWDGADVPPTPAVSEQIPEIIQRREVKYVGKVTAPIIELNRGCKIKCPYCQYAWMKPYREQSGGYLRRLLRDMGKAEKRLRLSSADIPQHSAIDTILEAAAANDVRLLNQDGALVTQRRALAKGMHLEKTQRFGIDGMSERIRKGPGKRLKTAVLLDIIREYVDAGVTRAWAYNIFGFPGEQREDFLEWDDTLRQIVDIVPQGFTWVNGWNAFLPMPMTPLAGCPSSYGRDSRDFIQMRRTRDWAGKRGVTVLDMPERTSLGRITRRMLAVRGTEATAHIVKAVALRKRITDHQIQREFRRVMGFDLHGKLPAAECKYA